MGAVGALKGGDLVFEAEDRGRVRRDEGRADCCAARGEVVRFDEAGIVGCCKEIDPVGAAGAVSLPRIRSPKPY